MDKVVEMVFDKLVIVRQNLCMKGSSQKGGWEGSKGQQRGGQGEQTGRSLDDEMVP